MEVSMLPTGSREPHTDLLSAPALPERELVERAREGDKEAFGELVRMHRARALGIAGSLTQDVCMAEDIVQEAIIRAFLNIGSLADSGRFQPWLHRIVRNQAYMKLRRGGPFANERPFASFTANDAAAPAARSERQVDWTDIDSILFHLANRAAEQARQHADPETYLARKDMLVMIRMLVQCLTPRERAIFEARFFDELSPSEIASMFQTSSANIYNSLSRARAKLQKERIRIAITGYVARRAEQGLPRRKLLAPPNL